jgi:hypothetical protein
VSQDGDGKEESSRGRKQDPARVAGGQGYEVRYEAKKTGRSAGAVDNLGDPSRTTATLRPTLQQIQSLVWPPRHRFRRAMVLTRRYRITRGCACRILIIGSEHIETVGTMKRRIGAKCNSTIAISMAFGDRRGT